MTESQWTRKICGELKKCNAVVFAVVAQQMQEPGWPDRYVCHRRWQGWLEFKGARTRLQPLQKRVIDMLNERQPGLAFVVRFPGIVENSDGEILAEFTTALELLEILSQNRPA